MGAREGEMHCYQDIVGMVREALDTNTLYCEHDNTNHLLNRMLNQIEFFDKNNKIVTILTEIRPYIQHDKLEQVENFNESVRILLEDENGYLPKYVETCIGIKYLTPDNKTKYILGYSTK